MAGSKARSRGDKAGSTGEKTGMSNGEKAGLSSGENVVEAVMGASTATEEAVEPVRRQTATVEEIEDDEV